jgi:hypothetical protein
MGKKRNAGGVSSSIINYFFIVLGCGMVMVLTKEWQRNQNAGEGITVSATTAKELESLRGRVDHLEKKAVLSEERFARTDSLLQTATNRLASFSQAVSPHPAVRALNAPSAPVVTTVAPLVLDAPLANVKTVVATTPADISPTIVASAVATGVGKVKKAKYISGASCLPNTRVDCANNVCPKGGPGCEELKYAPGQCSFPYAEAIELCLAWEGCAALNCNRNLFVCQARSANDVEKATRGGAMRFDTFVMNNFKMASVQSKMTDNLYPCMEQHENTMKVLPTRSLYQTVIGIDAQTGEVDPPGSQTAIIAPALSRLDCQRRYYDTQEKIHEVGREWRVERAG